MAGSSSTAMLSLSLLELATALRSKSYSITQVVEQVLAQQTVMHDLNAMISVAPLKRLQAKIDEAQLRQDRGQPLGPLDGVPVVVKDNFCTSWSRTTCASNMLRDYTPPYDATLVHRLEQAGAIIIGKSNMDEFGMGSGGVNSVFGPTKNIFRSGKPYTLSEHKHACDALPDGGWLASGGSSAGSATAVASGIAYCGLGSDTGGSVRAPAAFCGLVGLKPSYGALSRNGLVSLVNSMDCPGVLAKSCDDCAAVMSALVGPDQADSTSVPVLFPTSPLSMESVAGLVVGVPQEYHCSGLHPQILQQWQRLADTLSDAGAKVVPVSLPHTPYAPSCYSVLNTTEVASNFTRYTGVEFGLRVPCAHSMEAQFALSRAAGLSQVVRDRVLAGNYFLLRENRDRYLLHAMKVRRLILEDFRRVWSSGVQVLLTPTTLFPAPRPDLFSGKKYSELTYLQDLCTSPANLAGLPALSLPVGYTTNTTSCDPRDDTARKDGAQPSAKRNGRGGAVGASSTLREEVHDDAADEKCDMSDWDVVGSDNKIEGLPLALQLIGPYASDRRLLEIGKWIELTLNVPRIQFQDPL